MRSDFRFPRSTVFLMCVILAGVVIAIEKAKIIQLKYGPVESTSRWAIWDPRPLLLVFAVIFAAVAAGWAIRFALGRTGIHRFSNMQFWPEQR